MKNELCGIYRKEFNIIKKYINREVCDCEERVRAIEDLYDFYIDCQNENTDVSQIHSGSIEEYAFEIINGLPKKAYNHKKKKAFVIITIVLVFLGLSFLGSTENMTKNQGFYYVSKNSDKYDFHGSGNVFPDVWKFEVNGNVFSVIEESKDELYENVKINKFFMSEDGKTIYLKGKTKALYQEKTSGKILLPIFQLAAWEPDIHRTFDLVLNYNPDKYVPYDSEPTRILLGDTMYNGKITKYRFNMDGSINFEITFTESHKEDVKNPKNLLYINCFFFEWKLE
ncbi:MAG: hypothetical protein IJD08_02610 [Oscillospiraceae bacterium]|nr:hypothetical protein [Oscillospiraceae bacterium]